MLNQILTPNQTRFMTLLSIGLLACEGEQSAASAVNCGAGTILSAAGDGCEPRLAEGLGLNDAGEIVANDAQGNVEAALAAALVECRAENIASARPLHCAEGTAVNAAGDGCEPTAEYRAAALAEGAAAVVPFNCGEGTEANEAGDACVPTVQFRASILAEGAATVVPLNCGEGTEANEAGDTCVPTAEFRAAVLAEGAATVVPLNCGEGTEANEAGDTCFPTAEFRAAAFAEGAATVVPITCGEGTRLNEARDMCSPHLGSGVHVDAADGTIKPTATYDAAKIAEGRNAISAAAGTAIANDTCTPNMAADVDVDADDGMIKPTAAYHAAAVEEGRVAGVASVDITADNQAAYDNGVASVDVTDPTIGDTLVGELRRGFVQFEPFSGLGSRECDEYRRGLPEALQLENASTEDCAIVVPIASSCERGVPMFICLQGTQIAADDHATVSNDYFRFADDAQGACSGEGTYCEFGTIPSEGLKCENGAVCTGNGDGRLQCDSGAWCAADGLEYADCGVGSRCMLGGLTDVDCDEDSTCFLRNLFDDGEASLTCEEGAVCHTFNFESREGSARLHMTCKSGSTCAGEAFGNTSEVVMNCEAGSTCHCKARADSASCLMNCDVDATCTCESDDSTVGCL